MAKYVVLIVDAWTSKTKKEFVVVAAIVIDQKFKRDIFVLGILRLFGRHNAENVKKIIEEIVNSFEFNKNKISGIVCDEGSNLVLLISQLDNINFDDFETEEEESEDGEMEVAEEGEFFHSSSEEDDEGSNEEKTTSNKSLSKNFIEPFENVPYETEYDFQRGDLIKDIDLVIGSNQFPRFNCSAHKLNIAVRKAVTNSPNISELVSKCGKYVANFRKSKHMYGRFRDKKFEEEEEILSQDIANMPIESDNFEENRGDIEEEFDGLKGLKSIRRSSLNSDNYEN
ncbi:hypothetical protein BpHYR1_042562 [Brachionus plicatilis]|uniref:DUF659 domain-containing protein n=1 Tax=Brachionus plicatilis TaxID=10195 RepID=A0A3M7SAZ4_BRAPC|nr:hypothetical protein BpHYR1_042562 [Brachionus plicatilis]